MKILLIFIPIFFLSGCFYINDRGISDRYYNECHEYYDSMGIYHKTCDKNMIEFKDVKRGLEKTYDSAKKSISK